MDWTSHFEDSGEQIQSWILGRVSRFTQHTSIKQYNTITCYAFTINYILGIGLLNLPYAIYNSGIILGTIILAIISFITLITVMWIVDVLYVANYLIDIGYFKCNYNSNNNNISLINTHNNNKYNTFSCNYHNNNNNYTHNRTHNNVKISHINVQSQSTTNYELKHQIEIVTLVDKFYNRHCRNLYQLMLVFLMLTGLISYSIVFVNSLMDQITLFNCDLIHNTEISYECIKSYRLLCFIFACIVVPLSCLDLTEQITIQVMLTIARFITVGIMLFGSIIAMYTDVNDSVVRNIDNIQAPYIQWIDNKINGLGLIFSCAIFSQLFQHSVPGLIQSLNNKTNIRYIFTSTLLTTFVLYTLLGCICASYFGQYIHSAINLNFNQFTWGYNNNNNNHIPLYLIIINYIVVLFPAIDIISVYPLVTTTLANSIYAAISDNIINTYNSHYIIIYITRIIASLPPIIISYYIRDLRKTVLISGLFSIIVALFIPAMLQLASQNILLHVYKQQQQQSNNVNNNTRILYKSPYNWHFNHRFYCYLVLIVGTLALLSVIITE